MPDALLDELAALARRHWPSPWREAILDGIAHRTILGTPVVEYMPDRLVRGRLCLVGDAAHVATPMTGNGFGTAASDAIESRRLLGAGEDRQLIGERPLVGGARFAAGDIGREVRISVSRPERASRRSTVTIIRSPALNAPSSQSASPSRRKVRPAAQRTRSSSMGRRCRVPGLVALDDRGQPSVRRSAAPSC
jgi:hypothetical protein